jgi:hypothetical protein
MGGRIKGMSIGEANPVGEVMSDGKGIPETEALARATKSSNKSFEIIVPLR